VGEKKTSLCVQRETVTVTPKGKEKKNRLAPPQGRGKTIHCQILGGTLGQFNPGITEVTEKKGTRNDWGGALP